MVTIVVGFVGFHIRDFQIYRTQFSYFRACTHYIFARALIIFVCAHSIYSCARTEYIHARALNIFIRAHSIYLCARTQYIHARALNIFMRAHSIYSFARTQYIHARALIIFMRAPLIIFTRAHSLYWCTRTRYICARALIVFMRRNPLYLCARIHYVYARTHVRAHSSYFFAHRRMFLWTCTHTWMFLDPHLWFFALKYSYVCLFVTIFLILLLTKF